MSLKAMRNIFILGTVLFFVILVILSMHSLSEVSAVRTAEVTDQVVSGKRMWQHRNCNDCHTILGIGGYWAPDMTKIAGQRDTAYLTAFLKDPAAVKPGTLMPDQRLTDQEVSDLVAFLEWVNKIDTNNWPPKPMALGSPDAFVFEQKGCPGCHQVNGRGAAGPGPDLSGVGSKNFPGFDDAEDFFTEFIVDPRSVRAGSTMPAIPMTPQERDAIVRYLAGLK